MPPLSYQTPPIVPRCSCGPSESGVECMEQPRSGRCSAHGKRSDPPSKLEVPDASRTSDSLDTGSGLLHDYLRSDPAGSSWRTVIPANRPSSHAICQTSRTALFAKTRPERRSGFFLAKLTMPSRSSRLNTFFLTLAKLLTAKDEKNGREGREAFKLGRKTKVDDRRPTTGD